MSIPSSSNLKVRGGKNEGEVTIKRRKEERR